jgi:hypothetical protein
MSGLLDRSAPWAPKHRDAEPTAYKSALVDSTHAFQMKLALLLIVITYTEASSYGWFEVGDPSRPCGNVSQGPVPNKGIQVHAHQKSSRTSAVARPFYAGEAVSKIRSRQSSSKQLGPACSCRVAISWMRLVSKSLPSQAARPFLCPHGHGPGTVLVTRTTFFLVQSRQARRRSSFHELSIDV